VLVDPAVRGSAAESATVSAEAPIAIRYEGTYGLPTDRVSVQPNGALELPSRAAAGVADAGLGSISPARQLAEARASLARATTFSAPARTAADDNIIVIVTNRPAVWAAMLPSAPYLVPAQGHANAGTRYYIVSLGTGGPNPSTAQLVGNGPRVLAANPAERGQVATAIALAWVDGVDSIWTGR
jgi:hypothetical protein